MKKPGHQLYRHFDKAGRLLYVGISSNFAKRTNGHKSAHWFRRIASMTVEHFGSRTAAQEAERAAIQQERPIHNDRLTGKLAKRTVTFRPDDDVAKMLLRLRTEGFAMHRFFNTAIRERYNRIP